MNGSANERPYTLVTGATGFVGHVLLAELLRRGHDCAVLTRQPGAATLDTLVRLLGELGVDATPLRHAGRLIALEASLPDGIPSHLPCGVARIVHAAASTRFEPNGSGEPFRTNAVGTESLLRASERWGVREFHLVSTAFVCGITRGPVPERVLPEPPAFRNAYEHSKWTAERHAIDWARRNHADCTVYRPSIVVGAHSTGRTTRFCGLYLALRALDRFYRGLAERRASDSVRALRIEGRAQDRLNLVPVDHLAILMADVIGSPAHHGAVYNLVDPAPPTNRELLELIEACYGATAGRFVEPGTVSGPHADEAERKLCSSMRRLRPYLLDPPEFDRDNVASAEARFGRRWPRWDGASIGRVIAFARQTGWGRHPAPGDVDSAHDPYDQYFHDVLPEQLERSGCSEMVGLTTTLRFIVDGVDNGEWSLHFDGGRLARVRRGANGVHEDFAYRMGVEAFWGIVSARLDPQEAFIGGRVEVTGDVERALKMGMVFRQIYSEHPYTPGPAAPCEESVHA